MKKILTKWFAHPRELSELGILGMNRRNAEIIMKYNPRSGYKLVDDKLKTKALAQSNNLTVPETYGVISSVKEFEKLPSILEGKTTFVIKPVNGAGGKGVLVIKSRKHDIFFKSSGASLTWKDLRSHLINIIGGVHSLGGQRDQALIEYRVESDTVINALSHQGAPDIRIILFQRKIVMSMIRSATSESGGRANLHQGGIGIGIDNQKGRTTFAYHRKKYISHHPDTEQPLLNIKVPFWSELTELSLAASHLVPLQYLGVDLMIDANLGPTLIEINARPGLAIQSVNKCGLIPKLKS